MSSSAAEPNSSPALEGQLALEPAPLRPQSPPRASGAVFQHFRDVVRLVGERRDVKLKAELERHVRPVRVAPGTIEISLLPGAPPGLPGELARKLEAWTGERFLILISKEEGEPPLREQERTAQDRALREAYAHPAVRAVLDRFPGSEITAVRDLVPPSGETEETLVDTEQE
jgi:DNA polymerase-3 subunit gamma/tau